MSALPRKRWTPETYLTFEGDSEEKHEYIGGEVYSMTGASENHNLIVANTIIALGIQLRKRPCKLYPSDMLLHIPAVNDYYYPDITVVCGEANIVHDKRDILLNPTLIIEVLSPSTENYDRGDKFHHYASIPELRAYVLIDSQRRRIECFARQEDGAWQIDLIADDDTRALELKAIDCSLILADVYEGVEFEGQEG